MVMVVVVAGTYRMSAQTALQAPARAKPGRDAFDAQACTATQAQRGGHVLRRVRGAIRPARMPAQGSRRTGTAARCPICDWILNKMPKSASTSAGRSTQVMATFFAKTNAAREGGAAC
jgi:hypothetical protein